MALKQALTVIISVLCISLSVEANPQKLKVLTFNGWYVSLPVIGSKYMPERSILQVLEIVRENPDIIAFQEIWSDSARKFLVRELGKRGYEHSVYSENSLFGGNGLLIISKYELDSNLKELQFSVYTATEEYAPNKGAIKTRVNVPGLGWVDFINAHLGAVYDVKNEEGEVVGYDQEHLLGRGQQALELANWIPGVRTEKNFILAIDLNAHFYSFDTETRSYNPEYSPIDYLLVADKAPAVEVSKIFPYTKSCQNGEFFDPRFLECRPKKYQLTRFPPASARCMDSISCYNNVISQVDPCVLSGGAYNDMTESCDTKENVATLETYKFCPEGSSFDKKISGQIPKLMPGYLKSVSCVIDPSLRLNLKNTFHDLNPDKTNVFTFDTKVNSFAGKGHFSTIPSEFIDYVFVAPDTDLVAVDSRLVFNEPLSSDKVENMIESFQSQKYKPYNLFSVKDYTDYFDPEIPYISDHFGVMTTFEYTSSAPENIATK